MTPNYSRPVIDAETRARLQKPVRGSKVLAKEKAVAEETAEERLAKKDAKARDMNRCRWPEPHKCRGGIEGAHVKDKSTGGRASNVPQNILTVCAWIHRRGPVSIHGGDYEIEPLTKLGTNGPIAVYRRVWNEGKRGASILHLIAKERGIHVWERP
jgi:hypothetical protein